MRTLIITPIRTAPSAPTCSRPCAPPSAAPSRRWTSRTTAAARTMSRLCWRRSSASYPCSPSRTTSASTYVCGEVTSMPRTRALMKVLFEPHPFPSTDEADPIRPAALPPLELLEQSWAAALVLAGGERSLARPELQVADHLQVTRHQWRRLGSSTSITITTVSLGIGWAQVAGSRAERSSIAV